MASQAAASTSNTSSKRAYDTPALEPDSKKQKVEPFDLYPLFSTICSCFNGEFGMSLKVNQAVSTLSQNTDNLIPFSQVPCAKIHDQFRRFLELQKEYAPFKNSIFSTLGELYQLSLVNSQTNLPLEQTTTKLPEIKRILQPGAKDQIQTAVKKADALLKRESKCTTPQLKQQLQGQIDQSLAVLRPYRELKQCLDEVENQRMCDLAKFYHSEAPSPIYKSFMSDYPQIVTKISSLKPELDLVSNRIQLLMALKLKLQTAAAEKNKKAEVVDPIQARLLIPYGTPIYEAFASHFWDLLFNSYEIPEIDALFDDHPAWNEAEEEVVDYALLNAIGGQYLPDHDINDWMTISLSSLSPAQLTELESSLAALSKTYNETRESKDLEKSIKDEMMDATKQEMLQVCVEATKPEFFTLPELKTFLDG